MSKILLFVPIIALLTSCGLKNKITSFMDSDGQLGVSKQNIVLETLPELTISESSDNNVTTPSVDPIKSVKDTPIWFYIVPFVVLITLALLVFRLKKQNMKSL